METAYKIEQNRGNLLKDLDIVELGNLIDILITERKLFQFDFENRYESKLKVENVIDRILQAVKNDDRNNRTETYDILLKFLYSVGKNNVAAYLESSPGMDPEISDCYTLARNMSLNNILLPKILITISGEWNVVVKALGIYDEHNTKESAFKMWFNYEGYKENGLLTLLKKLRFHSDVCSVNWKLLKKILGKN